MVADLWLRSVPRTSGFDFPSILSYYWFAGLLQGRTSKCFTFFSRSPFLDFHIPLEKSFWALPNEEGLIQIWYLLWPKKGAPNFTTRGQHWPFETHNVVSDNNTHKYISNKVSYTPKEDNMTKLQPWEVGCPTNPNGAHKLLAFHLSGLGFSLIVQY